MDRQVACAGTEGPRSDHRTGRGCLFFRDFVAVRYGLFTGCTVQCIQIHCPTMTFIYLA